MKIIVNILLFSTLLLAKYPTIYSALGDEIYSNTYNIAKLKEVDKYLKDRDKIDRYIIEIDELRQEGLLAQKSSNKKDKTAYLKKLRNYSKINDFYKKNAYRDFKLSMKNRDNTLFSQIINSGMIDVEANRYAIMEYYKKNKDRLETRGVIERFLDEDRAEKIKKSRQKKSYMSKKRLKEEKIKRLKKNDLLKKEAIEKKLEEETKRKKIKIREEQEKNLSN